MRKLYLLLTFLLAVTCIVSIMAASADLYESYEAHSRIERLGDAVEKVQATVVEKRIVKSNGPGSAPAGRVYVELRSGEREGETEWEAVGPRAYERVSEGDVVTALVTAERIHVTDLHPTHFGRAVFFVLLTLLSLGGTIFLVGRIRRMPS